MVTFVAHNENYSLFMSVFLVPVNGPISQRQLKRLQADPSHNTAIPQDAYLYIQFSTIVHVLFVISHRYYLRWHGVSAGRTLASRHDVRVCGGGGMFIVSFRPYRMNHLHSEVKNNSTDFLGLPNLSRNHWRSISFMRAMLISDDKLGDRKEVFFTIHYSRCFVTK